MPLFYKTYIMEKNTKGGHRMKVIYLAGGCFWGTQKYLSLLPGVIETEVGYANGKTVNPTYRQVCDENTGHAETVKVTYNPEEISTSFLLECFYEVIDPTSLNKQGEDVGIQYRTGIYYVDSNDEKEIRASLNKLRSQYQAPILVEVTELENYYIAEEYHQEYLDKNPEGYCHINPKMFEKAKEAKEKIT